MRSCSSILLGLTLLASPAHAGWFNRSPKPPATTTVTATPASGATTSTSSLAARATGNSGRTTSTARALSMKQTQQRRVEHEAIVGALHASFENLHTLKRTRWWKALKAAGPIYEAAMAQAEASVAAIASAKSPAHVAQLREQALLAYQVAKQTSALRQSLWYSKPALLSGAELARVEKISGALKLGPHELDEAYAAAVSGREDQPAHSASPVVKYSGSYGASNIGATSAMFTHSAYRTPMQNSFAPVPMTTMENLP